MIGSFYNDDIEWYTRIFGSLIRNIVEKTESDFVDDMAVFWGSRQQGLNYVAFSTAQIIIDFSSVFW